MIFFDQYFETDPAKKNAEWADNCVTHFRTYWKPLIGADEAAAGMNIILSRYNMDGIRKMFKDPKKLAMEFLSIAIMEKIRNMLIGEAMQAGISVNVNCLDPVQEEKKKDESLLANRSQIEAVMSHLQQSIGLPEYKMKSEDKNGKSPFSGNIDMFDDLGLNSDDGTERGYFMRAWHRLKHEMDAQEIVNALLAVNEFEDNIENWINDILGKKVIACQSFVNEMTGAYEIKRLIPEDVHLIPGKRADGGDAICKGYMEVGSVGDIIKRMGNSFSMDAEWRYLVNAVNFHNNTSYNGLWDGRDRLYSFGDGRNCIHINDFMAFKIQIGYIEWKSYDQTVFKAGIDYNGNLRYYMRGADFVPDEGTGFTREEWYNEKTFKSFFFSSGSNTQRLFKFGKLFHQVITGSEDEYSSFSIKHRKVSGPTAAEVAKPWIEIAQESFTKFRWMVRKAKPKGRSYNYESLVQMAKHMIKTGDDKTKIQALINLFEEGINEIFTIPTKNGQVVGGGNTGNHELPNGLDPTAITFQGIIDWAVGKIKDDLAISDIRDAYSQKQNDVYKLQEAADQSSRNATSYVGAMIDGIGRDEAKHALLTAQDIIEYRESKAYKYLLDLVGYGPVESLEGLQKVAMHRYATVVNNFSTFQQRQQIKKDTQDAFQQGQITYDVKLLVDSVDDFRKAAYILAFEKQRADKLKQQAEAQAQASQLQQAQALHGMKMEEINADGNWKYRVVDRAGWWAWTANRDDNATKIQANEDKANQRIQELGVKTDAAIRQEGAKAAIQTQNPV